MKTGKRLLPASGWTLRALAGRTFRPPKPIFAEVCCGQAYQRNINVRKETAWTYGFEGVYQPSPVWRVSLYLARTDFDDFIVRLVGWSQLYRQTYALANVPSARSETAEIGAKWSPTDWFTLDGSIGWLSFFNRGESDVKILIFPPSRTALSAVFKPIDRIPYRPVRTGSLTTRFTPPHRVVLSLQGNYTGQQLIQQFAPPPITSAANGIGRAGSAGGERCFTVRCLRHIVCGLRRSTLPAVAGRAGRRRSGCAGPGSIPSPCR